MKNDKYNKIFLDYANKCLLRNLNLISRKSFGTKLEQINKRKYNNN